jgi:hypothetical protein
MRRWLCALATFSLLAACSATVRTPQARIETNDVSVTLKSGGGPGTFCPPGQAKKGRC